LNYYQSSQDELFKPLFKKTMTKLSAKTCIPCQGGTPPLKSDELQTLFLELENGWEIIKEHHLEKSYGFKNFRQALAFTNLIGELAEQENHHPDIFLTWGKVKVTIWTHKIDGLTESDFIFAAKSDLKAQ
jgi:4a-hydroxytetrahydrobiopterin dehydratase